jgi:hypothetical protein
MTCSKGFSALPTETEAMYVVMYYVVTTRSVNDQPKSERYDWRGVLLKFQCLKVVS